MKKIELNIQKVVAKEISTPSIEIIAILGYNYSDVAILTKGEETYFWSNITSAYRTVGVDNKEFFKDEYEAIFRAMLDGKNIYQFENIKEFSKWLYKREETTPNKLKS
jgi:hypothetical protein